MEYLLDAVSNHLAVKFFAIDNGSAKRPEVEIIMIDEMDKDMKTIRRRSEFSVMQIQKELEEMRHRLLKERSSLI